MEAEDTLSKGRVENVLSTLKGVSSGRFAQMKSKTGLVNILLEELRSTSPISEMNDQDLMDRLEDIVDKNPDFSKLGIGQKAAYMDRVFSKVRGYDILDPLLQDKEVSEIMVNSHNEIFFEKEGRLSKFNAAFDSEKSYRDIIQKIVSEAGKEVNMRKPICDCRMLDGSRVNVVLDPIADGAPVLTIRKFRDKIYKLDELVEKGSLSPEASEFLKMSIKAGLNIFVCGGTGSGKTTMLNALSNEIPPEERIITIEDARELNFQDRENWIAMEARSANAKGQGLVTIKDLIRTSLRMRPDRIIVGEVRGEEAIDMLQAMNTGHDGSLSTGHANSIPDMQYRLETMVLESKQGLPIMAVRQQIGAAIDLFIHLSRMQDHSRKVLAIDEVLAKEGNLCYHHIFKRDFNESDADLVWTGDKLENRDKFLRAGITGRYF